MNTKNISKTMLNIYKVFLGIGCFLFMVLIAVTDASISYHQNGNNYEEGIYGDTYGNVASISVSGASTVKIGSTLSLTLKATYTDGTTRTITSGATWSPSDSSKATVSNGTVTGVSEGSVVIAVVYEGCTTSKTINVIEDTTTVTLTDINLSSSSVSLSVGGTANLPTATAKYSDGSSKSVTVSWSISTGAAQLNGSQLKGVYPGSGTATASYTEGGVTKTATCSVTVENKVTLTEITVLSTSLEVGVGSYVSLPSVKAIYSNGDAKPVQASWSFNSGCGQLESSKIKGIYPGSGTATASYTEGGVTKTATCIITVKATTVNVTGVSLSNSSINLTVGQTHTLSATVSPTNATDKDVTWSHGNRNIAMVDSNGNVTAVGVGTTTITVKTKDGDYTATCTVTVKAPKSESISLNNATLTINVGQTGNLTATVTPSNADVNLTWSSSSTAIATVSGNGTSATITGIKEGETIITVRDTNNSSVYATCKVTVSKTSSPTDNYTITLTPASMTLKKGESKKLVTTTSGTPQGTITSGKFTSSDSSIAEVDDEGNVTAKNVGVATITATVTTDAGKKYTATCKVTVVEPFSYTVSVPSSVTVEVGKTTTVTPTINPLNGGEVTTKTFIYESENASIATVTNNGTITGVSEGSVDIYITSTVNGNEKITSFTVKVIKAAATVTLSSIEVTPESSSITVGSSTTLTVTGTYSDGSKKPISNSLVEFSSNAEYRAVVDSLGNVYGEDAGNVTITAKYNGKSDTCSLTIKESSSSTDNYTITLTPTSMTLKKGESKKLVTTTSGTPQGTITSGKFTSSDSDVAEVDIEGNVTAKNVGVATITATVTTDAGKKYTATCKVTVVEPFAYTVSVPSSVTVGVGKTVKITPEVKALDGGTITSKEFKYDTWDNKYATVSSDGTITGVSEGYTDVYVTSIVNGNEKITSFAVTVTANADPVLKSVSLSRTSIEMEPKQTTYLQIIGTYSDGTTAKMTDFDASSFSSSNTNAVTVNKVGTDKIGVHSQAAGTSTITVTYLGKTYTCTVTVSGDTNTNIPLTGIYLNKESVSLSVGEYDDLTVSKQPGDATDTPRYHWWSDDTSVATVSQSGRITGVKAGSTLVWVMNTSAPTMKDCVRVYVSDGQVDNKTVPVTGLTLNKKEIVVKVNSYYKLNATITPSDATNKTVKWSMVSGSMYATVDSNGLVHAKNVGTATLRATSVDNSTIYAECKVTVITSEGTTGGNDGTPDIPVNPDNITLSNVNTLSSLSVNGVGVSSFDPYGTSFRVIVPFGTTQAEITSTLTDPEYSNYVQGYGNRTVFVNDSATSSFQIKVKAENGDIRTYTIDIVTDADYKYLVKDINISKYNIDFSNDDLSYQINIGSERTLKIDVILNSDEYTYEIVGNENLVDGSTIIVRAFGEGRVEEYSIIVSSSIGDVEVNVPSTALSSPVVIILSSLAFIGCGAGIVYFINNKKRLG